MIHLQLFNENLVLIFIQITYKKFSGIIKIVILKIYKKSKKLKTKLQNYTLLSLKIMFKQKKIAKERMLLNI